MCLEEAESGDDRDESHSKLGSTSLFIWVGAGGWLVNSLGVVLVIGEAANGGNTINWVWAFFVWQAEFGIVVDEGLGEEKIWHA